MSATFSNLVAAPPDPLFDLIARYKADTFDKKVDLSVGAYRDDTGKPWVLPVVRKADRLIAEDPNLDHEYLPIAGNAELTTAAAKLILGKSFDLSRVASVQTISGTGANHTGGAFLRRFPVGKRLTLWLPDPTWGNHNGIFGALGYDIKKYPYFDAKTRGLAFEQLLAALDGAQPGDVVLLHACAHNPTGVDPTQQQWRAIAEVVKKRGLYPFFDCAYQGFASGDLDNDAYAVRYFLDQGLDLLVCQSFSKNFGLYGERCGVLHIVSSDADTAKAVKTQLQRLSREEISNPPAYGSRIVARVLNSDDLFQQWVDDFKTMADRIILMRKQLRERLESLGTPGTWDHITNQIGMFSFTGLSKPQVDRLISEFHIYLAANGRISMAGLNSHNVDYVARAINTVVRDSSKSAL